MIINKYLQIFSEEYLKSKSINKLIKFTEKTLPSDGTDKIFIGCVLIMFNLGFTGPAACREYLISIVKSGKEKIGDTNLLSFYVNRINTNKAVSKYLKNINQDINFAKHIDLIIEYLEQFSFDFSAKVKSIYELKMKEKTNGVDKLLYLGHASLRIITNEGRVIYIDPYAGDNYSLDADLILVTHDHYDHNAITKVPNYNQGVTIITNKEALKDNHHQTFNLPYVKVEAVEAGYNKNHDVHNCVGYLLTLSDGITIYIAGDTSITKDMTKLSSRNIDYAFLPCDGIYNMDVVEASKAANIINAKHTIPYHMIPDSLFSEEIAKSFTAPNKLIIKNNEEIILEH